MAATPAGSDAAAGTKVYATRVARSFTALYQMQRGGIRGSGELAWKRHSDTYEAYLKGTVAGFTVLNWASSGGFDAAGVAPHRYVERRLGKSERTVTFLRSDQKIAFSGSSGDIPFVAGAQDRMSWMVQLPAILAADPGKMQAGARVDMYVVGTRGRAENWRFESAGVESVRTPSGTVKAVRLTRALHKPEDTRAEVWVDPMRQFIPVRVRLTLPPFDAPLELLLVETDA